MVTIRLSRLGKRNDPFYRIVAIEKRRKRAGKALANLGYWHPKKNDLEIKRDEIKKWVEQGAQISKAVQDLMKEKNK